MNMIGGEGVLVLLLYLANRTVTVYVRLRSTEHGTGTEVLALKA